MEIRTKSRHAPKRGDSRRLSVGFILARRFTLCAFANFVDVLRLSADEGDRSRPILCGWRVLSATMDPIVSSSGIAVQPEERLGDPARFDYIVVVGGLIDEIENLHPDYVRFLHRAAIAGVPLVGVCTGAFALHRAGLMHGYKCCVSWFHHDDFLEQFDGLKPVSDQIFVVDRDRLTCSGGASSAHLAAYLVDRHVGRAQARKSLNIMIIDEAERAETPQPGMPLDLHTDDPMVKRALLLMQQTIDTPIAVDELARRLGANRRQLERHFQGTIGMAPTLAYKIMRLEYAEFLLKNSQGSVTEIANSTGFCDSSHFIRAFRERRGVTPAVFRSNA
ncbi:GlxA family transcriptional regulator [Mesorhizobium comanense]|uniref:GlxA family transcriptional regulator n=1 Tax=Mesorhizobium comanense TaxID=2502215 RepID=UPI0010F82CF7|nr:GlxA family transcriptional regulator [Mesorhizobium comanense]